MPTHALGMPPAATFSIVTLLIKTVILLILGSIALHLTAKAFKTKHSPLKTAFTINLILAVIAFVVKILQNLLAKNPSTTTQILTLILTVALFYGAYYVLAVYLIKKNYQLTTHEAFTLWLAFIITYVAISTIVITIETLWKLSQLTNQLGQFQQLPPPTGATDLPLGDATPTP